MEALSVATQDFLFRLEDTALLVAMRRRPPGLAGLEPPPRVAVWGPSKQFGEFGPHLTPDQGHREAIIEQAPYRVRPVDPIYVMSLA